VPIHDPIHDDKHFEKYLKQFRPLAPEELPAETYINSRARSTLVAALAAVAAIVISALLILYPGAQHSGPRDGAAQWAGVPPAGASEPLTIQSADALLTHAASFKAAVDAIAVPSHTTSFNGKQSAFDVLSKDSKI
jgi:hypothetical protein